MSETSRLRIVNRSSPERLMLERYARERRADPDSARTGLVVTTSEDGPNYTVWVLGIVRDNRYLIVTAPTTAEGSLIAVVKGSALTCRWFNPTTAFRFRASIAKLAFEPIPVLYLELPRSVEARTVRRVPRATINLHALLKLNDSIEAIAVDLSVAGARVGVPAGLNLDKGRTVGFVTRLHVLGQDYLIQLKAVVAGVLGGSDAQHPELEFYGLDFPEVPQFDLILLHAYVQERLAHDADWLSRVLESKAR